MLAQSDSKLWEFTANGTMLRGRLATPKAYFGRSARPTFTSLKCLATVKDGYPERSPLVEECIVLFIFQQDLGVQLQRAINYEQFEVAKQIRTRRDQIDEVIERQNVRRSPSGPVKRTSEEDAGTDTLSLSFMLQNQLNEMIKNEDYAGAADVRDRLQKIKDSNAAAEALSSEWDVVEPVLSLGQRVRHRTKGYQAVVVGWDKNCCETEAWQAENGIDNLRIGTQQPFYHLLVDDRDWGAAGMDPARPPAAYVAEELLWSPAEEGTTWVQKHGGTADKDFLHPYGYLLFLGSDNHGDFIPTAALRDRYNEERRDVYPPEEDGDRETDANGGAKGDV